MKHTPGPWDCKVFNNGAYIIADGPVDELSSCIIASRNEHPDPPTGRANARLIAAAPELLDALVYMRRTMYSDTSEESIKADEAIAKATGEEV